MSGAISHPYFPRDLVLPNYVPNDLTVTQILGVFFGAVGAAMVLTWMYAASLGFCIGRRLVLCWFMMCGLIHTFLEGYFGLFHANMPQDMSFLAQVWKEYGKGDSRYISSDNFAVCMESITAFVVGPLCFLAVFAFLGRSRHRYLLQLVISVAQLYGDVLYFFTEYRDGFAHSEMWHPQYFWFYFVFMNGIWIVVPSILIIQAWDKLSRPPAGAENGVLKKYN